MNAVLRHIAVPELSYTRRPRLIVEAYDAVTLALVHEGLRLRVEQIDAQRVISSSGRFVWFEQKGAFDRLLIDTGTLPYVLPQEMAIPPVPPPPPPPAKPFTYALMRLELAPSTAYPFPAGLAVLRGTVIRNVNDNPLVPLGDAQVRLRWIDDNAAGETWVDAPTLSRTSTRGDFAAIVRLAPNQIARADAQRRMRVRVAVTRAGSTRLSPELSIPFDRVADAPANFAWDDLQP